MSKLLLVAAILALAASAHANLVVNGTFGAGLASWATAGQAETHNAGDFGTPDSPSGAPWAGAITSWGGGSPLGSITQNVGMMGPGTLSGELYAAAHFSDATRRAGVEVLWNGSVVASLWPDSSTGWAIDFPWVPFSVPVTGTGSNVLKVQWTANYAEWTWDGVDNLAVNEIPEPGNLFALGTGLFGLVGLAVRRRK
jgi:hypothetical protein